MKNKKHISLLVAAAILFAYAIPFGIGALADTETVWTFENASAGEKVTNSSNKEKEWYIKNVDLGNGLMSYSAGELNTTKQEYSNAFEIDRTSKTTFTVNGEEEEVVGALKFGGKSNSKARYLTYTPSANGIITAYVKHGSPTKDNTNIRSLIITQGSESKTIATIGTDNPYVVGSLSLIAGTEVKITCDDNVSLAKLVFVSSGSDTPSATEAPADNTPVPAVTNAPEVMETTIPTETETPGVTDTPGTTATPAETKAPEVNTPTPVPVITPTPVPVTTTTPVPGDPDMAAVMADAENLKLNAISQTAVYSDIDLDKKGDNGSEITWESSNSKYIDIQMVSSIKRNYTGVVTRPQSEECVENGGVPVTLTATLKKGNAEYKKTFDVSVRKWNPMYYNDFQCDVGKSAEGTYKEIADNVTAADGKSVFRGIRVDTLKESRAFESFAHGDKDTPQYFDKRVMSTDEQYGKPAWNNQDEENFAFYYNMYNAYGGSTTYNPLWIKLIDPNTGTAPEGIVMLSMDVQPITTAGRFNMGFGTSKASQMCRFLLYNGTSDKLGYDGGGLLRTFNSGTGVDFMGGKNGYYYPLKKWLRAVIIANSESHKWDFYFEGMQVATGLDFRNAEDIIPTIEFTMDRNMGGAFLIDNIYVENMTEDYRDTYWDAFELNTIPYDNESETYVADKNFLLQYQGTEGLSGNYFSWKSSNGEILSIATERIATDKLLDYGYTEEQIRAYKDKGINDVAVVIAKPGTVEKDTYVTLTAKLELGNTVNKKDFKVLVKKNTGSDAMPTKPPKGDSPSGGSSGGSSGGGGGSSSSKGNTPSAIAGASEPIPAATPKVNASNTKPTFDKAIFTDLYQAEWAREAIEYLYAKDIVNGYGDGLYGVNDNVTREQFVRMLLTALNIKLVINEESEFEDVEADTWYANYVNAALKFGIINGVSATEFGVGEYISRQDMAVMCMRALNFVNSQNGDVDNTAEPEATSAPESTTEPEATSVPESTAEPEEKTADASKMLQSMTFGDEDEISDYAAEAVNAMTAAGYLQGDDNGNFAPKKSLTRAETAVVLYRIIK